MIPVVDLNAATSFAIQHPAIAVAVILALLVAAYGIYWITHKYPRRRGTVRLVGFVALAALAIWVNWEMFNPQPSVTSQVLAAAQKYQQEVESGIDVSMVNDNQDPRPGDRLSFREVKGGQCVFHGVVQSNGVVAINRKICQDGAQTLIAMTIPVKSGPLDASGQKIYKAYLVGESTSLPKRVN